MNFKRAKPILSDGKAISVSQMLETLRKTITLVQYTWIVQLQVDMFLCVTLILSRSSHRRVIVDKQPKQKNEDDLCSKEHRCYLASSVPV